MGLIRNGDCPNRHICLVALEPLLGPSKGGKSGQNQYPVLEWTFSPDQKYLPYWSSHACQDGYFQHWTDWWWWWWWWSICGLPVTFTIQSISSCHWSDLAGPVKPGWINYIVADRLAVAAQWILPQMPKHPLKRFYFHSLPFTDKIWT